MLFKVGRATRLGPFDQCQSPAFERLIIGPVPNPQAICSVPNGFDLSPMEATAFRRPNFRPVPDGVNQNDEVQDRRQRSGSIGIQV
jgi:hypothetical protein